MPRQMDDATKPEASKTHDHVDLEPVDLRRARMICSSVN